MDNIFSVAMLSFIVGQIVGGLIFYRSGKHKGELEGIRRAFDGMEDLIKERRQHDSNYNANNAKNPNLY